MIPFKGRVSFKQYIPRKHKRYGIKHFIIADSANGYNLNTTFYSGRDDRAPEQTLPFNIVMSLMEPYKNKGYKLFLDGFYTTYKLVKELEKNNISTTGTFFAN
jgi:hypothetical protein